MASARTLIYRRINYKGGDIGSLLKDRVKKCCQDAADLHSKGKLYTVDTIIDPTINIFDDYQGERCVALLYGYKGSCDMDNPMLARDQDLHFLAIAIQSLSRLIGSTCGGVFYPVAGLCNLSAYVLAFCQSRMPESTKFVKQLREKLGVGPVKISVSKKNQIPYSWLNIGKVANVAPSEVYSLFPEHMVTFPKGEESGDSLWFEI